MQFYKICGKLIDNGMEEGEGWSRRDSRRMATKTRDFNDADSDVYCFTSEIAGGYVTLGIITTRSIDFVALAKKYTDYIGLDAALELPEEITLANMGNLLGNADRQNYIKDEDEVFERFGLDRICSGRGFVLDFGENLINSNAEESKIFASAGKLFANETLLPELERIYRGGKYLHTSGHPVHYIVECDDSDTRRDIYKIVLDALYANHRLKNCRYSFLDFGAGENHSKAAYEALYKISDGGAIVVSYLTGDGDDDNSNVSVERAMIETICEMAKRYRNKVLTIFCFPRECKKIKAQFYENLGTISFVELKEDFIGAKDAKEILFSLAKKNHMKGDKKLVADIMDDRFYLETELQSIFDEWFDGKLKTTVYPQYKDINVASKKVVKSEPKGTAYEELSEMIGLTEAKQVINKAINYYKMQKLYEEKGVKRNNPAMHMIFSGNPGTAKTTVARLFARIMRENGLLSYGHLVEVGRSELVGRFVGWTAQLVKSKFKEARGGVLFIDEAYSLVDDRDGSYGDEAINTIVQEMENHRDEVVVIFAGYPDKMESFLRKNPGLRSRIAFHVPFADYNSNELCRIADMISKKNGMKIEREAFNKLEKAFEIAKNELDFGNGRYVRNIFEQAKMNQASRLLEKDVDSITTEEIITITSDDIMIPEVKKSQKVHIGFC